MDTRDEITFEVAATLGRHVARFGGKDAKGLEIETGRVRSYPGLASEAPDTRGYYALAVEKLAGATRVLDAGCGSGNGARILRGAFEEVVAVDTSRDAVQIALRVATGVTVLHGDVAGPMPRIGRADGAVIVDLLGHARDPRVTLRGIHAHLREGARLIVAEARAYPGQSLRAPARRAFSPRQLGALVSAMGFAIEELSEGDGPFVHCVARAVAGDDPDALLRATTALASGDVEKAILELDRASESVTPAVKIEALVTLGDLRVALGDGDGAARALLAARGVDETDPRPAASLARLTLAMGDAEDALALARIAYGLDPACGAAACALAMAASGRDIATYHRALRAACGLSPDDEGVTMAFASSLSDQAMPAAALFAMERTRKYCEPLPAAYHLLLAELLLSQGRKQDATLEARMAEKLAPGDAEVAALWARIAEQGSRADAAR